MSCGCFLLVSVVYMLSFGAGQTASEERAVESQDDENIEDVECLERHKRCLFVVGVPNTGAHALVDVLNQHPVVKLQGSNGGLISTIRDSFARILQNSNWGDDFERAVRGGKYRVAWYQSEKRIDFVRSLIYLFNEWYVQDASDSDIVGYVETGFGFRNSYDQFKAEVDLLMQFCRRPKVIFTLNYNLDQVRQRDFWKFYKQRDPIQQLQQFVWFINRYNNENPHKSLIVSEEQVQQDKDTILHRVFSFLDLEFNPNNFEVNRFGNMSYL
eukprot:TRINITY_DN7112_c0_g1_i1.p1 TRINITY_DN7112_c0_g1~~TRINITY_DN7112_c0_g1_i1.p1  ORF type:complete len:270 (+),score=22.06 TRINITY_DN7112_c0_g1_i1:202-1011(+)